MNTCKQQNDHHQIHSIMTIRYRYGGPLYLHYRNMKFTYENYEQVNLDFDVYYKMTVIESDHPKLKVGEAIEQITINTKTEQIWYEKGNGEEHEFEVDKLQRKEERRRINKEFKIEANITTKRALRGDDDYHSSDYDVSSDESDYDEQTSENK